MIIEETIEVRQRQEDDNDGSNGLSPSLTYDPTQGKGTTAWQRSVAASRALNARNN